MAGRFLNMAEARRELEIFNSRLKRGEIENADKIVRLHMRACGCGAPGCTILFAVRKDRAVAQKERSGDYF